MDRWTRARLYRPLVLAALLLAAEGTVACSCVPDPRDFDANVASADLAVVGRVVAQGGGGPRVGEYTLGACNRHELVLPSLEAARMLLKTPPWAPSK